MQLKKPTYKKPREPINSYEESTWHANDTAIFENEHCAVFRDLYPCVKGHLLFIPKKNDPQTISEAYTPRVSVFLRLDALTKRRVG